MLFCLFIYRLNKSPKNFAAIKRLEFQDEMEIHKNKL